MGDSEQLLIYLAEKGALKKEIELSTIKISKEFKSSQQTVSRKLVELEKNGMIHRIPSTRGIKIQISDKGIEKLRNIHVKLNNLFTAKASAIKGKVESGLGEGSYYVSLGKYYEQFKDKLGIVPFKGTLNVKVDYIDFINLISNQNKITINGFKTENRTFGDIVSYKVKVNGVPSAVVIPKRTSHDRDVIEIISGTNFRRKFHLKDGDEVEISL